MSLKYNIGFWSYFKSSTSSAAISVEENLKSLPQISLSKIDGVSKEQLSGIDLIVIDAMELEIDEPILWIDKLFKKIVFNNIPIPCLIINKVTILT